jgi:hypothetical protein
MPEYTISESDIEQIRAVFLRQAAGETAHDIDVIDAVLARAEGGLVGALRPSFRYQRTDRGAANAIAGTSRRVRCWL